MSKAEAEAESDSNIDIDRDVGSILKAKLESISSSLNSCNTLVTDYAIKRGQPAKVLNKGSNENASYW
eukprot:CAMPEP_0116928240 /NCGR_PEP_ID=MMETSP0467-20121206/25863_1 /TAXON_ID=283647 /ORGANISM="Mesodinium pulex, Strain SPMC105" /LENGTH=67 /DNA_ID=CAMNT_0004607971 /DNA_START=253 /DNA_END=453 /DNA_ORIENTATION=+